MADTTDETITITKGERASFSIFLEKASGYPRAIDLTDFTAFRMALTKTDGSTLVITQTANANGSSITKAGTGITGQLDIILGAADTAQLYEGFGQAIDLEWASAGDLRRKRMAKALSVETVAF